MFQLKRSPPHQAKILVVDDRPDNVELLSAILASQGYEIKECDSGKAAIELAEQESPNLILLDISMPDMGGFAVCQALKKNYHTQNIPIIFISALKQIEDKILAFEFGGNDYITKPFYIEEVIARVETQLKSYYLQLELKAKNQQLEKEIKNRQAAEAKLLHLNQKLRQLATLDSLTGIANRHCFDNYFTREWQRGQREKFSLALIICDIDYFKLYNDRFGHQAGDVCLKNVATAIAKAVERPADLVARYGGEEFTIILPRTTATNAVQVAEKIRLQVKNLNILHPDSLESGDRVSLSLGIAAVIPCSKYTKKQLLVTADRALYQAKQQGRDRAIYQAID